MRCGARSNAHADWVSGKLHHCLGVSIMQLVAEYYEYRRKIIYSGNFGYFPHIDLKKTTIFILLMPSEVQAILDLLSYVVHVHVHCFITLSMPFYFIFNLNLISNKLYYYLYFRTLYRLKKKKL